jgi:hypothetical protein
MQIQRLKDERGVAMVTVLFVAAVLTVVASAGAFVAVEEFKASRDDRSGVQSLGYAESGIDQLLVKLEGGSLDWGDIGAAGCHLPGESEPRPAIQMTGEVLGSPGGTYDAELVVYDNDPAIEDPDDRLPPASCPATFPSPRGDDHYFAITSVGEQPAAKRVVRQVVRIHVVGLPIGIYTYELAKGSGTPRMNGISMVSERDIQERDKMAFSGTDPYYTLFDFYGSGNSDTINIPAAAHSIAKTLVGANNKELEHPPNPNCNANRSLPGQGAMQAQQSLWDGSGTADPAGITSGCPAWSTRPPTSFFEEAALERVAPQPNLDERDYQALAATAKADGIYCKQLPNDKLECTKMGDPYPPGGGQLDLSFENNAGIFVDEPKVPDKFIAYFDFPTAGDAFDGKKTIAWKHSVSPCESGKAAVIIVRNGSFSMEGNAHVVGALLLPEGKFTNKGTPTMEGTIIAQEFDARGTAEFRLTDCWVNNLPGPFLTATPDVWSEIDR